MKKRLYLQIAKGQFFQWSKEAKNKHFEQHIVEDEETGKKTAKGYRRYFDSLEGTLVKAWENTEGKFGTTVSFAFETDKGIFILTMNREYQSGQVTDYLANLILNFKTMQVGGYYRLNPYSITTNKDGSERTRALNGITVYEKDEKGDWYKFDKEDKFTIEFVNKDGEVETPGEIPGLVFKPGRKKTDKMKVDATDQTDALLTILDEVIAETEDYTLPASSDFEIKSANSAFDDEDDEDYTSAAEALGEDQEEEEEIEDKPKTTRISRTPNKIAGKKKEEPVEEEESEEEDTPEETKSTVDRRPRREPRTTRENKESSKTTKAAPKTVKKGNNGLPF